MSGYVGRLAPSPTGALHLGNARTFMIAWLRARSCCGKVILRIEDLDHPRDKPGAAAGAIEDLRWLGFDWDEEYVQSDRREIYRNAKDALVEQGVLYPCVCSRRDVENAQSAPHEGEQLHYPGTCRGRFASWSEACEFLVREEPSGGGAARTPCWRFRVPAGSVVSFDDAFAGRVRQNVSATLGDFPVARDIDGAGYTLAVVVDDLTMGVTEIVRGDDLLAATPAQIMIADALRASQGGRDFASRGLAYCHVPLVVGPDGKRLAKRHGDTRIAAFRESGMSVKRLIGLLASSCGWSDADEEIGLEDLVPRFSLSAIPRAPWTPAIAC